MVTRGYRFVARTLGKDPTFSVTAALTLALGIGTSTAIFSIVNGVLLRPLPYADPERLAIIWSDARARSVFNVPLSTADFFEIRERGTAFEAVAGFNSGVSAMVDHHGKAAQVTAAFVTPNLFSTLGARVVVGRDFLETDGSPTPPPVTGASVNRATTRPTITILGHAFWLRHFSGDSSVVGKTIELNKRQAHIVGVAAPDVRLLFPPAAGVVPQPDVYGVLRIDSTTANRNNPSLRVIARLKRDVPLASAQAQMAQLAADFRARFPVKQAASLELRAEPMQRDIVKEIRPTILALMVAAMFVLLIASANMANLLLVRAASRERELAVRAALGGSRAVLVRQMLAESLVLAGPGAVLGLWLAKLGIDVSLAIAPANLPRVDGVSIDFTVLAFGTLVAVLSAAGFGAVPALRASQPNLSETLRAVGRTAGLRSGKRLRHGVVIVEVALSFVLLVGAGLMLRSFVALSRVDPGFDPDGVLTFFAFNSRGRSSDEYAAFMRAMQQRLSAIPGVTAVTAATPLPLDGYDANVRWGTIDAMSDPAKFRQATMYIVLPGYFEAMKTKLIAGRVLTANDNHPASKIIVIDELLARKAFPNEGPQSAIGKYLLCRINTPEPQLYEVVGVVGHQRHLALSEPGPEAIFTADGMWGSGAAARWAVRTSRNPSHIADEVRAAVEDVDALVPVGEIKPMSDYVDRAMAPTRFSLVLIGVFGLVAAMLAAIGLYGVLSTTVRQRTREIGVRMALGAPGATVFRFVVGRGLVLSSIGIGIGLAVALALTRFLEKAQMLVSTPPADPLTYVSIAVFFLGIAMVACGIPARRASKVDATIALREE